MGIMTRKQGDVYLITSDQFLGAAPTNRAPKRSAGLGLVWTGAAWSEEVAEAKSFATSDEADDYTRANYARLSGKA
jgi:hypothetical protein